MTLLTSQKETCHFSHKSTNWMSWVVISESKYASYWENKLDDEKDCVLNFHATPQIIERFQGRAGAFSLLCAPYTVNTTLFHATMTIIFVCYYGEWRRCDCRSMHYWLREVICSILDNRYEIRHRLLTQQCNLFSYFTLILLCDDSTTPRRNALPCQPAAARCRYAGNFETAFYIRAAKHFINA